MPRHESIVPMMLANMRENGVRSFLVEAQLVAPRSLPEISLLNRGLLRHTRTCENHSVKGEKKAYGQCERNACGSGHGALLVFVSGQEPK